MTVPGEAQQRAARERKRVREYLAMIRSSRAAGVDEEAREYERNLADDFAALVERVEAAELQARLCEERNSGARRAVLAIGRDLDATEARVAELEEALRFIAEDDTHQQRYLHPGGSFHDETRYGSYAKVARAALTGVPVAEENSEAIFECGDSFYEVGCVRHPPITGTMCCPIHLKPYRGVPVAEEETE